MGFLDILLSTLKANTSSSNSGKQGFIPYGDNKTDGSHDHRTNKGEDRTPSQKEGDKKKSKG